MARGLLEVLIHLSLTVLETFRKNEIRKASTFSEVKKNRKSRDFKAIE